MHIKHPQGIAAHYHIGPDERMVVLFERLYFLPTNYRVVGKDGQAKRELLFILGIDVGMNAKSPVFARNGILKTQLACYPL